MYKKPGVRYRSMVTDNLVKSGEQNQVFQQEGDDGMMRHKCAATAIRTAPNSIWLRNKQIRQEWDWPEGKGYELALAEKHER